MADIKVKLHPAQMEIFQSDKRFKVVAAGRRFGKSRLAAWVLLINALQSTSKDSCCSFFNTPPTVIDVLY